MKTLTIFAALFLTTQAFALTDVEQVINHKLSAIKAASAECLQHVEIKIGGADLTALRFLSVIALNTTDTISADFTSMKATTGADCKAYAEAVKSYVANNDKQLESTMKGLQSCSTAATDIKDAVEALVSSGKDLTDLYVELKTLDYSQPAACVEAHKKILDEKNK